MLSPFRRLAERRAVMRLDGKRVLVIGASSGLGYAIAMATAKEGARVALSARRTDLIETAAKQAGNDAVALTGDVSDGDACAELVRGAVEALGGLDAFVYAPALGTLSRLIDADAQMWHDVFAINVIGAAQVTRAALPHLTASDGVALYISSVSGTLTPPWPGLGLYLVSKAALERMVSAWRIEHPEVRFGCLVVGPAGSSPEAPSEFGRTWDMKLAAEMMPTWAQRGLMTGAVISPVDVCNQVINMLITNATLSTVVLEPR
ncbi:MAG TPA: SDR family oxidoreductase [Acidimicrobiales bacterium]|nr:SDR family oxidoreductase [Acidimicrobiales bacterium]